MAYEGVRECAVCAWRETCRLKWRNEANGALFCPEFTLDLRLSQAKDTEARPSAPDSRNGSR